MRRPSRVVFALSGALSVACLTKPNPGFNDETGTSGVGASMTGTTGTTGEVTAGLSSETGTPTTATSDAITGSGSGTSTTGPEETTAPSTATTSMSSSTGDATTGEDAPATCAEARELGLGLPRGPVMLAVPEKPGATLRAWCEQEVAGGGWLLVARSAPGDAPPKFGWGIDAGDIDDDGGAYSLNLLVHKYPAAELLVGTYQRGKELGSYAFMLKSPAGFPVPFDKSAGQTSDVQWVLGGCDPPGGPNMLKFIGFTKKTDRFHLRDVVDDGSYGLYANGFALNNDDCPNSGEMHEDQGMIFVR